MKVAVKTLDIEKRRPGGRTIRLTLKCSAAYEAAVLYDDLVRSAKDGRVAINFKAVIAEETP